MMLNSRMYFQFLKIVILALTRVEAVQYQNITHTEFFVFVHAASENKHVQSLANVMWLLGMLISSC